MMSMIRRHIVYSKVHSMSSKYIVRLDDASHHMDLEKWKLLEEILDESNVKPVVAVVPRNKDPEISFDSDNQLFWNLIQSWQKKKWSIAIHGYQHTFHFVN